MQCWNHYTIVTELKIAAWALAIFWVALRIDQAKKWYTTFKSADGQSKWTGCTRILIDQNLNFQF